MAKKKTKKKMKSYTFAVPLYKDKVNMFTGDAITEDEHYINALNETDARRILRKELSKEWGWTVKRLPNGTYNVDKYQRRLNR